MRVRCTEPMDTSLTPQRALGDLVAQNPARARVFERYGIDYCCGGRKSLADACTHQSLSVAGVLNELDACDREAPAAPDAVEGACLAALADHIEQTHHAYLKSELPRLTTLLERVTAVHGERHPWLHALRDRFADFRRELESHMAEEERDLFPRIRRREAGSGDPDPLPSIAQMEFEHEDAGRALAWFREVTGGYLPPADACPTFRTLVVSLEALERDMHRHVHLENNVLFPRATAV